MGFFDGFFKKENEDITKEATKINWNALTSVEQIGKINQESENQYVVIFKHSTRCGVSSGVFRRFNKMISVNESVKMYYLDLLTYKDVSNEVSRTFKVVHQSPQLLIIKNRKVIEEASHYGILDVNFYLFIK